MSLSTETVAARQPGEDRGFPGNALDATTAGAARAAIG